MTVAARQDVSAETCSDISRLTDDELDVEIRTVSGQIAVATFRLLMLLAEVDRRKTWEVWGIRSVAHWLSWRCGFGLSASREHVRVARALRGLPLVVDLFSQGQLSYAKVRAITRVATPDNEALLVEYAKAATASQLEHIVQGLRSVDPIPADDPLPKRTMTWMRSAGGSYIMTIELPPDEGARMKATVDAEVANDDTEVPAEHKQVTAVVRLIAGARGTRSRAKGTAVVNVDVSAETLSGDGPSECRLSEAAIDPETARRYSCDNPVVIQVLGAGGEPLTVGRASRLFKGKIRREIFRRDRRTCRFPGCTDKRWVDAHHITHWSKGGESSVENGVVVCDTHHRLVHEGGFTVDHSFTFRTPAGVVVPPDEFRLTTPTLRLLPSVDAGACLSTDNGAPYDRGMAVGNLPAATHRRPIAV